MALFLKGEQSAIELHDQSGINTFLEGAGCETRSCLAGKVFTMGYKLVLLFVLCFETGSLCTALAILELTTHTRLSLI